MENRRVSFVYWRRGCLWRAGVGVAALVLAGCDRFTSVQSPDLVQPDQLVNATGAVALFNGAQSLFASAFNGSTGSGSSFVINSGFMSDEFRGASLDVITFSFDSRSLTPTTVTVGDVYAALSRARVSALTAVQALRTSAPTPSSRISQAFSIAGYSELFIAEMYCSGAPLTDVVGGLPATYGSPLTTQQVLQRAAANFDTALASAGTDATSLNLARLGKGRALLELAQYDAAAAAVTGVPTSFSYSVTFSSSVLPNIEALYLQFLLGTVADKEGINGLTFRTANDPRVPVTLMGKASDGTDIYGISGLNLSSSTVVTNGIEARLIEAEAALSHNDPNWLTTLNTLRATAIAPPMGALADPGTATGRLDLLFSERAFWLFGTGHRLADLRRLVRKYGRAASATFPWGAYGSGLTYSTDVNSALPVQESIRNPNFKGCIDRNA